MSSFDESLAQDLRSWWCAALFFWTLISMPDALSIREAWRLTQHHRKYPRNTLKASKSGD